MQDLKSSLPQTQPQRLISRAGRRGRKVPIPHPHYSSNSEVSNSQLVRPLLQCGGKGFFKNKNSVKKHFHCMATLCHKNIVPKVIKLIFKFMYLYSHAYSSVCLLLLQNRKKKFRNNALSLHS